MVDLRHPAIGTELAGGETFDRVAERDGRGALPHAIAAAHAVAYAHAQGIVHGRLSAASVLCGKAGETIVIGWEHARHVEDSRATIVSEPPDARRERDDAGALRALVPLMGLPPIEAKTAAELAAALVAIHRRGVVRVAWWPVAVGALALVAAGLVVGSSRGSSVEATVTDDRVARARAVVAIDPTRAVVELAGATGPDAQLVAIEARARGVATQVLTGLESVPIGLVWWGDGHAIAALDADNVVVWDAGTGQVRAQHHFNLPAKTGRMTADGDQLALFDQHTFTWGMDEDLLGQLMVDYPTRVEIAGNYAFTLAHGTFDEWAIGRLVWQLSIDHVRAFDVSDDRTTVALAMDDGSVHLRATRDLQADVTVWKDVGQLDTLDLVPGGGATAIDHDGRAVLIAADGTVRVDSEPGTIAIARDGRTIVHRADDVLRWTHDGAPFEITVPHFAGVAVSRDGRWLAIAAPRGAIVSLDTGAIFDVQGQGAVTAVAFAPDSHRVATAGGDASVRIWELPARPTFAIHPHDDVALSPDGRTLAISSQRTTDVIDLATTTRRTLSRATSSFAFGATAMAIGSMPIVVVPLDGGPEQELAPLEPPASLAFSHDGRLLAAGDPFGSMQIWELPSPHPHVLDAQNMVLAHVTLDQVQWSFDDHFVAAVGGGTVDVWNVATAEHKQLGADPETASIRWLPHGARLVIAPRLSRIVQIWDAYTHTSHRMVASSTPTGKVAVSPDGDRIALPFADRTIRIWNVAAPDRPIVLVSPRVATELAFDGERLLSRDAAEVLLWDLTIGEHALVGEAGGALLTGGHKVLVMRGYAVEAVSTEDAPVPATTATIDAQGLLTSSSSRPSSVGTGSSHP